MIETLNPPCITCGTATRLSCEEPDKPGFVHYVFECRQCAGTQSYVAPVQLVASSFVARGKERRSGIDTRSETEKRLLGERRSGTDRRSSAIRKPNAQPSNDQLSLFLKRVRRAMRDEKSRHYFGIPSGEGDFSGFGDVIRCLEWIEGLAGVGAEPN